MKRILLVLTLLALGSLASAQTFGFASAGGLGIYCNYEQLTLSSFGGVYYGYDNLMTACGAAVNANVVGYTANVKNVGGIPVFGNGVVLGDNIYDAFSQAYTGAQWTVFTKLKCNSQYPTGQFKGQWSWIGVAGASGFFFGDNWGFLSCTIPGDSKLIQNYETTVGKTMPALRQIKEGKK